MWGTKATAREAQATGERKDDWLFTDGTVFCFLLYLVVAACCLAFQPPAPVSSSRHSSRTGRGQQYIAHSHHTSVKALTVILALLPLCLHPQSSPRIPTTMYLLLIAAANSLLVERSLPGRMLSQFFEEAPPVTCCLQNIRVSQYRFSYPHRRMHQA